MGSRKPWSSLSGSNDGTATAGEGLDTNIGDDNMFKISRSELLRVLQGVAVATKTPDNSMEPVLQWASSYGIHTNPNVHDDVPAYDLSDSLSFRDWHVGIGSTSLEEGESRHLASLALGVAFLRAKSRREQGVIASSHLTLVWGLIYGALTSPLLLRPLSSVSRSAQGFLAVPLCSLVNDGNIDELFRLHVWLPDGQRGEPDFAVHSHQPFAQSWILAGEGMDRPYKVERVADSAEASHAEYALAWNDGKQLDTKYKTHQISSTVMNTKVFVRATGMDGTVHTRGKTYTIPEATFHNTEVSPDAFHATLFFFDSHRGFVKDARVLGPKDAEASTQFRDPAGVTSATLANMVDALHWWEKFMEQGRHRAQRTEWEHALQAFNSALNLCESVENFPNLAQYRLRVMGELGNTNRRFGRYDKAKEILEQALSEMEPSLQQIEFSGELGVVYRHMDRLEDAKRAFQIQYDTAKLLQFELAICRAVGNLGMTNYQLSQKNHDEALLDSAIEQLNERVQSARRIKETVNSQPEPATLKARYLKSATTWESIGLSRLSLCYSARGNSRDAISVAMESLNISSDSEDSTVVAMSCFFYGRALLLDGQVEEALRQFNQPRKCSPAIALCKEPSQEHRQYLRELVDIGVDMDLVDDQGYTALDYAVFNGDVATEALVLEGLREKLVGDVEQELEQRHAEARIRKGYRELFQEKLRPVLLSSGSHGDVLQSLRKVYADALAADEEKRIMFDGLKFVWYLDFLRFGKLPRSSDNLEQQLISEPGGNEGHPSGTAEFVIFFSYRWLNYDSGESSPDNLKNTQYHRMIDAVEGFLQLHPSVDRERLGIWVDHACINQEDPTPGVSALPMILVQCDAVISLVDDTYHQRAWCSVEVMMIQTLRKSYDHHLWYEHVPASTPEGNTGDREGGSEKWILQEGPMELKVDMAKKQLTFEEDRAKVLFLERQSKLLG